MESQKPSSESASSGSTTAPSPWIAYWQLLRVPAVFTAMADIILGFVVTRGGFEPYAQFIGVLSTSICLYWAGMVLNDVFDRRQDARERPTRPIPSGRVSLRAAITLSMVLIVAGLICSASVGLPTLGVAGLLLGCILVYDGWLKPTPFGPLAMGSCRLLNVMLGASTVEPLWAIPQLPMAIGLGIYIVGVTWFARTEAVESSRRSLRGAMGIVNLGLVWLVGLMLNSPGEARQSALIVLGVVALTINMRLVRALTDPSPKMVQQGVRIMLLSLVTLDALLVFFKTGNVQYAMLTLALLIPATYLSRVIPMT